MEVVARFPTPQAGSAEFVRFKLCGFLFGEHPILVNGLLFHAESGKSRRVSKPETLRYPLFPPGRLQVPPRPAPLIAHMPKIGMYAPPAGFQPGGLPSGNFGTSFVGGFGVPSGFVGAAWPEL